MQAGQPRCLAVVADDYGIGPASSAGILRLAQRGVVTGSTLLVNSPYAQADVRLWDRADRPMELGWHSNLTLDAPVSGSRRVPNLVNAHGTFYPLGAFLKRWLLGRLDAAEIEIELDAQLCRFRDLVGAWPTLVNSHQHVALFPPVGGCLLRVLQKRGIKPYVRRVREPWSALSAIAGARKKRAFLNMLGRRFAHQQIAQGFPGNDWLGGITDPPWVREPAFFGRWLRNLPGRRVELVCHPGDFDKTLAGRDCHEGDGLQQRRVDEQRLLEQLQFFRDVAAANFTLVAPSVIAASRAHHVRAA